jgi:hypothetical protein
MYQNLQDVAGTGSRKTRKFHCRNWELSKLREHIKSYLFSKYKKENKIKIRT